MDIFLYILGIVNICLGAMMIGRVVASGALGIALTCVFVFISALFLFDFARSIFDVIHEAWLSRRRRELPPCETFKHCRIAENGIPMCSSQRTPAAFRRTISGCDLLDGE